MTLGHRLEERLHAKRMSQSELARRVGTRQSTISGLVKGGSRSSSYLHKIARELETSVEYLVGETDDPSENYAPPVVHENVIEVPMIDLAYGMGGTFLDDVAEETEVRTEPFPLSFIRRYTRAKPGNLVFAEGIGDSMAPTITSNDLMLIDQSDNALRIADQIWAFSFGGVGMIKRLRPRPDGSVAILSDNPNVPEDRAVDDELFLIGRVVAKVSKL